MNLEHIVQLIETLYAPNQSSNTIISCQQQLQQYQKDPNSDQLAHNLLLSEAQNVQFFGALTYTVYFSNHNAQLDLSKFTLLLIDEISNAYNRKLSHLVINKLISNLAKVYLKLLSDDIHLNPLDILIEKIEMSSSNDQQSNILTFALTSCKIFAEELSSSNDLLSKEKHQLVVDTLLNSTTCKILDITANLQQFKNLWLDCLQSWMIYITKIQFDFEVNVDLNRYLTLTIELLQNGNDLDALNVLSDLYDTNPSLLNHANKCEIDLLLFSNDSWITNFINSNSNDLDNLSKLSRFITLYLDSDMINLASKLIDPNYEIKFNILLYLTNFNGIPILEDPFSVDLLDFWILFTEVFVNDLESIYLLLKNDENQIQLLNSKVHDYFLNLSQIYWSKAHLIDDLEDVEDDFINFRRDIGELFESLYSIARIEIFNNLITSITSIFNSNNNDLSKNIIISNNQLKDIEASLYLLTAISSIFTENNILPEFQIGLNSLFEFNFLQNILSISDNNNNNINPLHYKYLIKIAIKFLSEINWFYENSLGVTHLNRVLIFLFQNLNIKNYQESSSRAILSITDSCRDKLSELLNDFEMAANSMIVNKFDVEINVRSRIIRSYANILQTTEDLPLQANKISNFLDVIYNESLNAYQSIDANISNPEILENIDNFLLSMMSSLVGLARGLQLPADWEDYYDENKEKVNMAYNYWKFGNNNDSFRVHEKCLKLIQLFAFPKEVSNNAENLDSQILEQIFLFFKSGLSEPFPGPFVIEENLIIQFLKQCCQYSQLVDFSKRLEHPMVKVIELYGLVVSSNHTSLTISKMTHLDLGISDLQMDIMIDEILFNQFDKVINDSDILHALFNLFAGIFAKYPHDLLQNMKIRKILEISIEQLYLNSQQRFVVMSLGKLWSNLIYLRKGQLEDAKFVNMLLVDEHFGDVLVYALLKGFMNTSRSNIEFYSDIIRALTAKYGKYMSKWIVESFVKINMETNNYEKIIKEDDINAFTKKLILTRGNRAANRVIQDFWFTITGMVDYGM